MKKPKTLLLPSSQMKLKHWLRDRFPRGALRTATSAREITEKVIEMLWYRLQEQDSPVRVDIELDLITSLASTVAATGARIRSLVVFDGRDTFTIPLAVTQSLVRLDGQPIYVSHPEAAPMLLDCMVERVEAVLTAGKVQALA